MSYRMSTMADNCSARRAGSFPHCLTAVTSPSVGGGNGSIIINKGHGRLSSCRASFIHPNLKQTVPCRQNSFDSLNYSSSSDYENETGCSADTADGTTDLSVPKLIENDPDTDSNDRDMDHIRSLVCDDEVEMDEKDEAVSVSTQQELEWFKLAGLDALVAKFLDSNTPDSGKCEDVQLETLTKSQSDTVKRRLASLRHSLSIGSTSQLTLEGLSQCEPNSTDDKPYSGKANATRKAAHWRDVRDVFGGVERRSSSSSDSQDGEHDVDSSNISSRSDFISSVDSVDAETASRKQASPLNTSHLSPENNRTFHGHHRQAYCLTQPAEPAAKPKNPPRRWLVPLGGQAAADVVGHDPETGVRTLKINYKSGYDVIEQEPPVPASVWPKSPASSRPDPMEDIQLDFAYRLHPAGSPDRSWPNVVTKVTPSGICQIDDLLWEGDKTSIKQLALIELTRIFDDHLLGMQKRRTKPKKKIKNSPEIGVFGSSLDRLIVLDNNRRGSENLLVGDARQASHVPIVFQQMLNYLEECGGIHEEGILRICGETNRMRRLRAELDSFYSNPVTSDDSPQNLTDLETHWLRRVFQTVSVHDIASVMKQFLRDLPQPLLTNDLVDAFSQISDIPDRLTQIQALNLLVLQLPLAERATLKALLRTLRKMVEGEKSNKMSSANIAMIIAPNLFHPKGVAPPSPPQSHGFFPSNLSLSSNSSSSEKRDREDPAKQFGLIAKLSEITRIMIVYSHVLFTVPPSFLRQIRNTHVRELSAKKPKEKRIRRLDPRKIKRSQKNLPALPESDKTESTFFQQQFPQDEVAVIRVRLGRRHSTDGDNQNKVSTAIQVTPGLTAGDVVAKFLSSSTSLTSSPDVSSSSDKLNFSTSSGVSGSDKSSSSSNEDLLDIDGQRTNRPHSDSPRRDSEPPVTLQTHFLLEQGGNIGLRRLDHNVSMSSAYQLNPKATWIVRFFPDL